MCFRAREREREREEQKLEGRANCSGWQRGYMLGRSAHIATPTGRWPLLAETFGSRMHRRGKLGAVPAVRGARHAGAHSEVVRRHTLFGSACAVTRPRATSRIAAKLQAYLKAARASVSVARVYHAQVHGIGAHPMRPPHVCAGARRVRTWRHTRAAAARVIVARPGNTSKLVPRGAACARGCAPLARRILAMAPTLLPLAFHHKGGVPAIRPEPRPALQQHRGTPRGHGMTCCKCARARQCSEWRSLVAAQLAPAVPRRAYSTASAGRVLYGTR